MHETMTTQEQIVEWLLEALHVYIPHIILMKMGELDFKLK